MEDDDSPQPQPDSLLPYDIWAQEAMRGVAIRALQFAGEHGMPGEHHFYVSFGRTHQAWSSRAVCWRSTPKK